MPTNTQIVTEFIEAWSTLDATKLSSYFREDGVYHNMPAQRVTGRRNIEQFIAGFTSSWTQTTWDIIHIAEQGDVVFCERLDRTKTSAGDVDLPCFGVFEMRDGKIQEWRDYFDMNTFIRAMSAE